MQVTGLLFVKAIKHNFPRSCAFKGDFASRSESYPQQKMAHKIGKIDAVFVTHIQYHRYLSVG